MTSSTRAALTHLLVSQGLFEISLRRLFSINRFLHLYEVAYVRGGEGGAEPGLFCHAAGSGPAFRKRRGQLWQDLALLGPTLSAKEVSLRAKCLKSADPIFRAR